MPVTKDQAHMLAAIAVACRPVGAPRWDEPGVVAAIAKLAHLHLADVTHAAIRAAEDSTAKTPGVITATTSIHWRDRNPDRPKERPSYTPDNTCGTCGRTEVACRANQQGGHDFEPITELKRKALRTRPKGDDS